MLQVNCTITVYNSTGEVVNQVEGSFTAKTHTQLCKKEQAAINKAFVEGATRAELRRVNSKIVMNFVYKEGGKSSWVP